MKRVAFLSVVMLLLALPLIAQTSAVGTFNFKGTEGLQTIDFNAVGDECCADGYFTLVGPALVSEQPDCEDPKSNFLVPDFTMKVQVDCMSILGSRVTLGGTASDADERWTI